MKKYLLTAGMLLISVSQGWASVAVTSFKVTLYEIDFYNSTTSQWITAGTGTLSFDLATVGSGQVIGNYISGANLPNGNYTQIRLYVSRTMNVTANDGTYYTDGTSYSDPNGGDPAGGYVADLSTTSPAQSGAIIMSTNNGTYQSGEYSVDVGSGELEAIFYSPKFSGFTLTGASKTINLSISLPTVTFVEGGPPNYAKVDSAPTFTVTVQ